MQNTPKPKFVVNIICKNEEKNIVNLLKTAVQFADKIVINDTGSSDRTVELIEHFQQSPFYKFPIFLINTKWEDDFSKARNKCLEITDKNSWVLFLDGDDKISYDSVQALLAVKEKILDEGLTNTIYQIKLKNLGTNDEHIQNRIIPHGSSTEFHWEKPVHEQIVASSDDFEVAYLDGILIEHTGYLTPEIRREKSERNLVILLKGQMGVTEMVQIGDCYSSAGQPDRAIFWYQQALSKEIYVDMRNSPYQNIGIKIGICYEHMGWLDKAIETYTGIFGSTTAEGRLLICQWRKALGQLSGEVKKVLSMPQDGSPYAAVTKSGLTLIEGLMGSHTV